MSDLEWYPLHLYLSNNVEDNNFFELKTVLLHVSAARNAQGGVVEKAEMKIINF